MAVTVETLEKLERRITLTLAAAELRSEVQARLRKLSRTMRADGFRPGKVPMSLVEQRYGYSVQSEVLNDKLGAAFSNAANEAKVRVAGAPRLAPREGSGEDEIAFDATFEVYPEVKIGDLSSAELERAHAEVTEEAVDRTVDILRQQRRTFSQRPAAEGADEGDRVTIDFEGKLDGEPFAGGKAEGFPFVVGDGRMLPVFDQAVRGMRVGESKTFPLVFPADYGTAELAGKEADFLVTMRKIEVPHLPAVDEGFAKQLGVPEPTVEGLRADVRRNLEREVRARVASRNKAAAMDALSRASEFDVPMALVDGERQRLIEAAREDLKARGAKDAETAPMPSGLFQAQAERRVRLGLALNELVEKNALQAKPEELQAHIDEMSQSYEKPAEVARWYLSDRQRMAEVRALVEEKNATDFIFANARVADKTLPFDELMQSN